MTITCPASLTLTNAQAVLRGFRAAFALVPANEPVWLLDLSPLEHFDSSALAVLVDCRRQAQHASKRLVIEGVPLSLVELAKVYGVTELIDVNQASGAA
jgi:phospholipid transport system transporter-binding protein